MRQLAIAEDGTIIDETMAFDQENPGIVIESENLLLKHDRGDFAISGQFQTAPNEDGGNRAILDNMHALGGFAVMVGRADRSYKGKLFFTVTGPGEDDDVTLFSDERVDDNQTHMFAVYVTNGAMQMVIDGVEQQTVSYGPGTTATAPPQAPVTIGGDFVGTITDLRMHPDGNMTTR